MNTDMTMVDPPQVVGHTKRGQIGSVIAAAMRAVLDMVEMKSSPTAAWYGAQSTMAL